MSRAVAVMRMHLTDRLTLVVMPLAVLASAFAINAVIWAVVPVDGRQTGAAASLWLFLLASAALGVTRGLPFALGMGASRRAFTEGTVLTGAVLGVGMGTFVALLQVLERMSGGWWLRGHFFWFAWFAGTSWVVDWLVLVVSLLATFLLGAFVAALWVRFRIAALVVGVPASILLLGGGAALLSWRHGWDEVLGWFGGLTPLATTGWCALLGALLALGTWAVLRRVRA